MFKNNNTKCSYTYNIYKAGMRDYIPHPHFAALINWKIYATLREGYHKFGTIWDKFSSLNERNFPRKN